MSMVGEAIISASLQVLLERLASPQLLQFAQVFVEFKKWEKTLIKIYAVLDDAEHKQLSNQFVKIWLSELRDLAYDVEDILDEFSSQPTTSKSLIHSFSNPMFKFRIGSKMKAITARLNQISIEKNDLELRENPDMEGGSSGKVRRKLPSTCLVDEARIFGRERDRENVIEFLMRDYCYCDRKMKICVISIIGMAGVGKTTLAQLVYNDPKVEDCFDLKVWACVSDDFDVLSLTKSILESVTQRKVNVSTNLNLLQGRLQDVLTDKKFLLILDDVWNENYHNWDVLFSPFTSGALGSRVLVTTRNRGVASISGSVASYHLKELPYESCLPLFTELALGRSNFDAHPDLKAVGEGIVEKCKGLPLVAKTLGSLLHTKVNLEEWEDVFHSQIWDLPEEHTGIIPALMLSYHCLPSHLKQCFAYCSIFPKGYEFGKEELVLLWMAEGFLQQPKGTKRMEILGAKCFDDLLSRSFFQQSTIDSSRFVMHDLINDLAQCVAGEFSFRLEDGLESESMQRARHVSYTCYRSEAFKKFQVLYKAQSLRTFLPLPVMAASSGSFYMRKNVLCQLLPKLRRLRVLSLNGYCISELSTAIGKLKHLRYLDLSHTLIRTLPESVNTLCNLQTLILHSCGALSKLPAGIVSLVNLRHLDITNTEQLRELPLGIGKLINLRTLSKFMVRKSSGLKITELKDMLRLQGKLAITGLHNVEDIIDAGEANLQCKQELQELNMEWSNKVELQNGRDYRREMNVLEMLQPHKNLRVLKIEFYGGMAFPSWIGHPSFSKLVSLNLKSCTSCSSLPSLGKLPSLEDLVIEDIQNVTSVGLEFYAEDFSSIPFPSLKTLKFCDMLEWEDWCSTIAEEAFDSEFPRLNELCIRNCPKLIKRLPNRLPSLLKLDISNCPLLEVHVSRFSSLLDLSLEECNEIALKTVADSTPFSLANLKLQSIPNVSQLVLCSPAVKVMRISNLSELTNLRSNGAQLLSSTLEQFELSNCGNLKEFPDNFFNCTSLSDLKIKRCSKLVSLPRLRFPCPLTHIAIEKCEALECLPDGMMTEQCLPENNNNVCNLESLEIIKCPSLKFFSGHELPTNLKLLKIWDCGQLEPLTETMLQNAKSIECLSLRKYPNLKALPDCLHTLSHLTELHISYCDGLESFPERGLPPNLRRFYVFNCENLKSLPSNMRSLTTLQHLGVSSCPELVSFPETGLPSNLTSIRISNCKNLPGLSEWGFHKILSLKDLTISGVCPNLVSFGRECLLPATLTHLCIGKLPNLKSLSGGGLQHLS